MLNMMNRGFLPYRAPDGGGPATMQIGPDTTAADAGAGTSPGAASSSYTNQSLTPIPFMQPFSQTQSYEQPMVQPFSATQPQQRNRQGSPFMQGMLNFMARRGIDRFIDPRLRMSMRRAQPQPQGYGQFGGSFAQRTLPVASNFGGGVPANVGGAGMGDFSGVNPYGTTY